MGGTAVRSLSTPAPAATHLLVLPTRRRLIALVGLRLSWGEGQEFHMPRLRNETATLLKDLRTRLDRLVEVAKKEGREEALAEVRSLVGPDERSRTRRKPGRRPSRKPAKRRKKRKTWWDTATKKQKAARVKKMLAGRGLKPKRKRKAAKKMSGKSATQ